MHRSLLVVCLVFACGGQITPPSDASVGASNITHPVTIEGDCPTALAINDTSLVWDSDCTAATGQIRAAFIGDTMTPTTLVGEADATALAVNGSHLYWATPSNSTIVDTAIEQCTLPDCNDTHVHAQLDHPSVIGLLYADDVAAYWPEQVDGSWAIESCATGGCTQSTVIVTGQKPITEITTDQVSVYWTDGQSVFLCPKSGCADVPTLLISAAPLNTFAVDSGTLYWSSLPIDGFSSCAISSCTQTTKTFVVSEACGAIWALQGTVYFYCETNGGSILECDSSCGSQTTVASTTDALHIIGNDDVVAWTGQKVITVMPR